ncbi:hypothetical protein [Aurantimonas sp. NFXS3]|uniref:hypothetical protein n=1 Tax=Aurantimonas sp. NFXS3 TaxID=2818434 RepID=UPI003B8D0E40
MPDQNDPQLKQRMMAIEERRVAIEEKREHRLQAERERELGLAERQAQPKHWAEAFGNPFLVAVVAGILALAGNGLVAFVNNIGELDLATRKEQSDLVLAALGTEEVDKVKQNLRLLAEAKLITSDDRRNSILQYLNTLEEGQGPGGLGQSVSRETPSGLGFLQHIQQMKSLRYQRALDKGRMAIGVVGDGWLNYPLLLKDIGDQLSEEFAVFRQDNAGECIESLLFREVPLPSDLEFVLVSAGLCELFGENGIVASVAPPVAGESPLQEAANRKFGALAANLAIIVDGLMLEAPNAQFALHGYDYLPSIVPSHPLASELAARGYQGAGANDLSRRLIDEFNDIAAALAVERSRLTFVDLRGTLDPEDWYDQLFPSNAGFKKITETIRKRIDKRTGATSDQSQPPR